MCDAWQGEKEKNMWKNPTPHSVVVPLVFWVGFSWVAGRVRKCDPNLRLNDGFTPQWMHMPVHICHINQSAATRHIICSWRWLKMHSQNINLLLPFGLRGAQWAEQILACFWPFLRCLEHICMIQTYLEAAGTHLSNNSSLCVSVTLQKF